MVDKLCLSKKHAELLKTALLSKTGYDQTKEALIKIATLNGGEGILKLGNERHADLLRSIFFIASTERKKESILLRLLEKYIKLKDGEPVKEYEKKIAEENILKLAPLKPAIIKYCTFFHIRPELLEQILLRPSSGSAVPWSKIIRQAISNKDYEYLAQLSQGKEEVRYRLFQRHKYLGKDGFVGCSEEQIKHFLGSYWDDVKTPAKETQEEHVFLPKFLKFSCEHELSRLKYIDNTKDLDQIRGILCEPVVSVDCEWKPYGSAKPSIMQMCSDNFAVILDLFSLKKDQLFQAFISDFFIHENVRKIGHSFIESDFRFLNSTYPYSGFTHIKNYVDIKDMHAFLTNRRRNISLKRMTERYLRKDLIKKQQCSDWSIRPLTKEQIEYAIGDTAAILQIYKTMAEGKASILDIFVTNI